jgi:hypothetical protein
MMGSYQNELRSRVDEILYYIWDPIGVAAEPSTRDEYSRYVSELLSLLENDANTEQIARCLNNIATTKMGMQPNDKHCLAIARLLLVWKEWLLQQWPLASDRKP